MNKLIFRIKHGFWKSDLWSLYYTIAKFVYPRLKYFVENDRMGSSQTDPKFLKECGIKPVKDIHKNWELALKEMLFAFDSIINDTEPKMLEEKNFKLINKFYKRQHNGFKLFGEYFMGLWD